MSVVAACPPTSIDPATALPDGTVGANYSQVFAASGSAATPYGYQVTSGLPAGFGLGMNSATGELSGTPTQAGDFVFTITATDTDGCNGGRIYALTVAPGDQTISFTSMAPSDAAVGGPAYEAGATASSGLAVDLSIDATAAAVCSISGSSVTFLSTGTCIINANQPGDANWNAAALVQQSFAVAQGEQTITFTSMAPAAATIGGPTYDVSASATSGLSVTFSIDAAASGVCSIAGSTVSFTGAGTCIIDANQAGDADWNAAPQAQQSFAVAKIDQTISFDSTAPLDAKNGGATYDVSATATSGLTVTFSSGAPGVCTVAGATVSFVGAGTCVVNADQAGDGTYNAAPQAQQSFSVAKGDQTISFSSVLAPFVATGSMYVPGATASSGLTVLFTIDAASDADACSINSGTVTFGPAIGTCIIDANQSGDSNWNAATQVQQSTSVLVPASAGADSHAVTGNVAIAPAAGNGVLGNDSGTNIAIKSYGAATGGEQTTLGVAIATAQGGSITLNADGSYSYAPPANFTGTAGSADSFKYVIDNALVQPSTATVTLNVSDRIMVVATSGVGAADCKPATPCTLATADAASAVTAGKDLVFVQSGSYSGAAFALIAGQAIVGQQVSLTQALTDASITVAADSVALPALAAGTAPTLGNAATVITLGGGNLVEYFTINTSAGSAIAGSSISNGASVHDIAITGTSAANGVNLSSSTAGTYDFSNLVVTTASGSAFAATGGGTVNVTTGSTPNTLATTSGSAVNIANTTIGGNGVTFQSISHNGNNTAISLNNTGSGAFTVSGSGSAGSGGTIQNIVGADAIALNTTGGAVTLKYMIIQDITASGDAADATDTHSGVDAIHGRGVSGGLNLENVTIQRISDNAINGSVDGTPVTNAPTATVWSGLTIKNSTIIDTNRFNVANRADANNEGAVYVLGIKGAVVVTGSTFSNAGNGLILRTDTSGTLDATIQSNAFTTLYKEIGTLSIGNFGIDIVQEGTLSSTIRIGDSVGEVNPALANSFSNGGDRAAIRVIANTGSTGAMKSSIAKNTFTVTDHSSPGVPAGSLLYNFPQSGVLLRTLGSGNYEAIFAANTMTQCMHADGGIGNLSIILEKGDAEVIVRNNIFSLPWDAPIELRADGQAGGQTSAKVQFANNAYPDGSVGDGTTDLGGPSPYEAFYTQVRNNGRLDLTIQNESPFGLTDTSSALGTYSFVARTTSPGDVFNLFLQNTASPRGYQLNSAAGTTYNLYRSASGAVTAQGVLADNNNTGGGGSDLTVPPVTNTPGAGTVTLSNAPPATPSITAP